LFLLTATFFLKWRKDVKSQNDDDDDDGLDWITAFRGLFSKKFFLSMFVFLATSSMCGFKDDNNIIANKKELACEKEMVVKQRIMLGEGARARMLTRLRPLRSQLRVKEFVSFF